MPDQHHVRAAQSPRSPLAVRLGPPLEPIPGRSLLGASGIRQRLDTNFLTEPASRRPLMSVLDVSHIGPWDARTCSVNTDPRALINCYLLAAFLAITGQRRKSVRRNGSKRPR